MTTYKYALLDVKFRNGDELGGIRHQTKHFTESLVVSEFLRNPVFKHRGTYYVTSEVMAVTASYIPKGGR